MVATHIYKEQPVTEISIKFIVYASHLEFAVIGILLRNETPTKPLVKEEVENMFRSGGIDGAVDWIHDIDYEKYIEKARSITRKLYPSFYTN